MSTEYDLVCHECKERFWVCSDGMSGPMNQLQGNKKLASFIITHEKCTLNVINEHDDSCEDYKRCDEMEWEDILDYGRRG